MGYLCQCSKCLQGGDWQQCYGESDTAVYLAVKMFVGS